MQWLRRWRAKGRLRTLDSRPAYALWAHNYPAQAHNALMEAEEAAMLTLLPSLKGQVVLDLGCGTGRYGQIAEAQDAARVIGIDNSPAMLMRNNQAQRICGTVEAVPLASTSIDTIICGLAVGHIRSLDRFFKETSRLLRPGGTLLISDFHPAQFASGAQRTFRAPDGKAYAVEHYPHWYMDYHHGAQTMGLVIETIAEPRLEQPIPVVLVMKLSKTMA